MRLGKRWLAMALLAAAACTHNLPANSPDRRALAAVEQAWRASDLPDPGDCLERAQVKRYGTLEAYVAACDGGSPGMAEAFGVSKTSGCLTFALRAFGSRAALIHVAPGFHEDMALLQHEAMHALTSCVMNRLPTDPFDALHSERRIWTAASTDPAVRAASVQTRALEQLPIASP